MKKIGRPKKKGAKKAGELNSGLCRFSFIAEANQIASVKRLAKEMDITVKDFMKKIILANIPTEEKVIKRYIKEHIKPLRLAKKRGTKAP